MRGNLLFFLIFFSCFSLHAQNQAFQLNQSITQNVVPNANATVSGGNPFLGPYLNSQITYQLLIAASQLTNLVGKNIISISFRNTFNSPFAWPSSEAIFSNYDVYIGQSVSPSNRTPVFALNAIGLATQVRSGNLVIPQNALSSGSNPNSFSFDIPFQIPYFYNGGNLLVEIRHFGSVSPSNRVDSIPITDVNYGILYSASWYPSNTTSINNSIEDNFSVINFKAEDVLSTTSFSANEITIFPNPTTEKLIVESKSIIYALKLYNLLGQLILSKDINEKNSTLDLSQFDDGTYLMTVENELGIEQKKIIKN